MLQNKNADKDATIKNLNSVSNGKRRTLLNQEKQQAAK